MTSQLKKISSDKAPRAVGPYSQAVMDGNFIFVSGQLPVDPTTNQIIQGDFAKQVNQVLDNLEAILKEAGASFTNVVRVDIFLTDLNNFAVLNAEYAKRFSQEVAPARQTIEVSRLPLNVPVEMSCIAKLQP